MRTTITLDLDVAKELKVRIKKTNMSFKDAVNDYLRKGLKASKEQKNKKQIQLPKPKSLNMKPGLSCENIWQLLEDVEG